MTLSRMKTGFTLVELLVVMAILGTLAAMLIPMLIVGEEERDNAINAGLMHTVDKALDMYASRNGFGLTPAWKASDPETEFGNHLFFKLGNPMSDTQKAAFKTALDDSNNTRRTRYPIELADPFRGTYSWGSWSKGETLDRATGYLPKWKRSARYNYYNNMLKELKKRDLYLLKSEMYTSDIIGVNDIGKEFISTWEDSDGNEQASIIDIHNTPLIYCYKYDTGIPEKRYTGSWQKKDRGFKGEPDPLTLDADGKITNDTVYIDILEGGRQTIVDVDTDGSIEDDWAKSDVRTTALPGQEREHELWSAGADGLFHAIRGDVVNDNNFSIHPDDYK